MHMMQSAPLFSLYASNIFFCVAMRREICVAMEFMKNAFKLIFRLPFTHTHNAKHTNINLLQYRLVPISRCDRFEYKITEKN